VQETWEVTALNGESLNGYAQAQQPSTSARARANGQVDDALEQNLRFQGQYLDRDTGLHYNTFRFYDPDIGRFISPDPIGLEGGLNLQRYADNPVSWIDPSGGMAQTQAVMESTTYTARRRFHRICIACLMVVTFKKQTDSYTTR
jgi:RHS repeat-associated protein